MLLYIKLFIAMIHILMKSHVSKEYDEIREINYQSQSQRHRQSKPEFH